MKNLYTKLKIYGAKRFVSYAISEVFRKVWLEPVVHSYSQKGEDLIIHKILKNKKRGFYIDVGTNDPKRFNNTKYFSLIGWRGINIEPDVNCFKKIQKDRKKDINLNLGVGDVNSELTFYEFIPDTLSTFSKKDAERYKKIGYVLVSRRKIQVKSLSVILRNFLKGKQIDIMSIDTEGYDKNVLLSNDWKRYRPKVVCIESVEHDIKDSSKRKGLGEIFTAHGYRKYLDNGINSLYLDNKSFPLG